MRRNYSNEYVEKESLLYFKNRLIYLNMVFYSDLTNNILEVHDRLVSHATQLVVCRKTRPSEQAWCYASQSKVKKSRFPLFMLSKNHK